PKRADGPIDLVLPSNIQAIEETAIHARTSGYVRERYVDIGDRVAAGKVLAQIDTPELDQELGQARAALAQTRSGLAQARASLVQAQATLNQARAGLDQSKTNEDFAGITAQRFTRLEHDGLVAHQDADEKRTGLAAAHPPTSRTSASSSTSPRRSSAPSCRARRFGSSCPSTRSGHSSGRSRAPRARSIPPRALFSRTCASATRTTRSCPGCMRRSSSASC